MTLEGSGVGLGGEYFVGGLALGLFVRCSRKRMAGSAAFQLLRLKELLLVLLVIADIPTIFQVPSLSV